jgi:hypothetical protein
MKRAIALLSLTLFAAPDRVAISGVEKAIDRRIETLFDEPYLLLGNARGIYLEGTGAVFTAEMALVITAAGPFAPKLSKEEQDRLRKKRLDRLPAVRGAMQEMLVRSAEMLPALSADERVVLGLNIFRRTAEDNTGIPSQIVMQATKRDLIGRNTAAIRTQEF